MNLSPSNREWKTMTDLVKTRFQLRDDDEDWSLDTEVHTFQRNPGESLPD